jgi:hypothetical protein
MLGPMNQQRGQALGSPCWSLTLPGVYDIFWWKLVGLGGGGGTGDNRNFCSPATLPLTPAEQPIYLSLLHGSIWRSHRFTIPINPLKPTSYGMHPQVE